MHVCTWQHWLWSLQQQAKAAGGELVLLLGNHELLRDVLTIVSGGAVERRVVSDVEGIAARVDARIGRAVASAASREA